jgi:catechol 2,3-dioxygenase-like lactoylglutathione lyase family enzyme
MQTFLEDMNMYIEGITHVAIDVSSPTRMERYLKEVFGLQTLRHGYWKGEYIRVMGSPDPELANPGFIYLHLRPGIPQGRLNHIGFNVCDQDIPSAVKELQQRGIYVDVDGDDMLYGPEDLRIQIDSFAHPRPIPDDPAIQMMEDPRLDPDLPCMVRGINHMAPDVAVPTRMQDWLCDTFGFDGKRKFARRGEYISGVHYENGPRDAVGRRRGLLALFYRPELTRVRLNHIAFEVDDAEGAIQVVESRGAKVDLAGDAMIHGPEDIWFQLDSRKTPYPVGHPANDPGVRLTD